jgi:hypothetical protein
MINKVKSIRLGVIVLSVFALSMTSVSAATVGQYNYQIGSAESGYRGVHKNFRISTKDGKEIYNFHVWLNDIKNNGAVTAEWSGSDANVLTLASKASKGSLTWETVASKLQPYASKVSKTTWKNIGSSLSKSSGNLVFGFLIGFAMQPILDKITSYLAQFSCSIVAKLLGTSGMCNYILGTVTAV